MCMSCKKVAINEKSNFCNDCFEQKRQGLLGKMSASQKITQQILMETRGYVVYEPKNSTENGKNKPFGSARVTNYTPFTEDLLAKTSKFAKNLQKHNIARVICDYVKQTENAGHIVQVQFSAINKGVPVMYELLEISHNGNKSTSLYSPYGIV